MPTAPDGLRDALADRYTLGAELGRGGMATVYRAHDLRHHRDVALKVFAGETAMAIGAERFLREIEIAAALAHPHILPVFDSGTASGFLYYVMPLAEGESLRARMEREGQLPLDEAIRITREVADGLSYAHSRNVVHRDIKPENILLQGGHAVIADFGIARAIQAAGPERLTGSGLIIGTPAYMSPEQASGATRLDGRSDVYSLACVLYEMLGGEPPHTGPTPRAILARQLSGEVRSLVPLRPSVTPSLDAAIRRALASAPADRFGTAAEFASALTRAAEDGVPAVAIRRPGSLVLRLGGVAVGVALIAGILLWALPVGASDRRVGVAVFPFRPAHGVSEQWTERVADYLATALDGTPGVRVADPWSLWRDLRPSRELPAQSPDPVAGARLATRAGVTHFVLGAIVQTGVRLDLTVRVYRAGVADPLRTLVDSSSTDSLTALVQRVAVMVIGELGLGNAPRVERYATQSAEALKAYLAAREAMRRGLVDSADVAIDRAIALDSNFALALVAGTGIKSWKQYNAGQPYSGLVPLAERAVRVSDSLSERERLRARAVLASVRTDGPGVAEAAGRIVQLDSTDLGAWNLLSYSHLAYGWQYGAGAPEARAALDRVLRLDPGDVAALTRRAHMAALAEDTADIRFQIGRLSRGDTSNALVRGGLLNLRAIAVSDAEFGPLLDTIARAPLPQWITVLRGLRSYDPARAERLVAAVRKTAGPGPQQRTAFGAQVQLALAEGRLREMDSLGRAGTFLGFPGLGTQVNLFLVASALAGISDSVVTQRALDSLTALVPVDSARQYFESRPVWWAGWVIGAYHAMFGDSSITVRWRNALGLLPGGGTSSDYRGALQFDLDARLAARRGDLRGALRLQKRAFDLWSIHANNTLEAQPEPAMRFHMALLLRAAGLHDSAAAILRSLVPPTTWMGFYTARASVELGEIAESRGDRAGAVRHYGMAAALWRRGGREVSGWRERAESGLRRSLGEPPGRGPN